VTAGRPTPPAIGVRGASDRDAVRSAVAAAAGSEAVSVGVLRHYAYTKSAPLRTATATIDGRRVELLVKDVTRSSLLPAARRVKPAFLHAPLREIGMYRDVLTGVDGTARYYGHHTDPASGRRLLVIERVDGLELCDVGDRAVWQATARWLGRFHTLTDVGSAAAVPLVHHTAAYYRRWMRRAGAAGRRLPVGPRRSLDHVLAVYARVAVDRLTAAPAVLLHGELYPSNVIVGGARLDGTVDPAGVRICPVDWETAARGPALLDLAALTTGGWSDAHRAALISAYRDAVIKAGGAVPGDLGAALAACRLHLAVQWLAWFTSDGPPPWQARDWLADATQAAERLA